ncbi:MAG: hypothetical protein UV79_C0019G0008, partial [candidate division TM6 bacterium GW2011_GWF2_43_17]
MRRKKTSQILWLYVSRLLTLVLLASVNVQTKTSGFKDFVILPENKSSITEGLFSWLYGAYKGKISEDSRLVGALKKIHPYQIKQNRPNLETYYLKNLTKPLPQKTPLRLWEKLPANGPAPLDLTKKARFSGTEIEN